MSSFNQAPGDLQKLPPKSLSRSCGRIHYWLYMANHRQGCVADYLLLHMCHSRHGDFAGPAWCSFAWNRIDVSHAKNLFDLIVRIEYNDDEYRAEVMLGRI